MLALGVPSSSFRRIVPAVAVYLISFPSIFSECLVCTTFSSGTGGFFSSLGFSAGFSGAGCGCCWAGQKFAPKKSKAAELRKRSKHFIEDAAPLIREKHAHRRRAASYARVPAASIGSERASRCI